MSLDFDSNIKTLNSGMLQSHPSTTSGARKAASFIPNQNLFEERSQSTTFIDSQTIALPALNEKVDMLYKKAIQLIGTQPERGTALLRTAAEQGSPDAMLEYGRLLIKDHKATAGLELMKTAACHGNTEALLEYGKMLESGIGWADSKEQAYAIYRKGRRNGDFRAMYMCGKLLRTYGQRVDEMIACIKGAVDKNVPGALLELGRCYKTGEGVKKDPTEAAKIFRQLSDEQDLCGMLEYALLLKDGVGVEQNQDQAERLLRQVLQSDEQEAKLVYAEYLESGNGLKQNRTDAVAIYKQLADNGNVTAQFRLGNILRESGDHKTAIKYYQMASDNDHIRSRCWLGMIQIECTHEREDGMSNLKSAADHGCSIAQYDYALFLEKAGGDPSEIEKYYHMASRSGIPSAMCNYASILAKKDAVAAADLFKKAADKGHPISAYRYAKMTSDSNESEKYLKLGAEKGHPASQYSLALRLLHTDPRMAVQLLAKAANRGYSKAQSKYTALIREYPEVAIDSEPTAEELENADFLFKRALQLPEGAARRMYFEKYMKKDDDLFKLRFAQILCDTDRETGVAIIQELVNHEMVEAKYVYANMMEEGTYVKQNIMGAKRLYQQAVKENHIMATWKYAKLIMIENEPLAFTLLQKAAADGLAEAQYDYAKMLRRQGEDLEALEWYHKAANNCLAKAQFRYGRMHELCSKIEKNAEIAFHYYEMSAKQGYAKAQNNYAHMLEEGIGVPVDLKLAADYYKKSADQGCIIAKYNLARILEHGIGVPKNSEAAALIYKELAQSDENGFAQYHYARMCHNGIGVPEDYNEAKKYYLKAIDKNISMAKQNYGVLLFTKFHKWDEAAAYCEMASAARESQDSAKYNYSQLLLQGMGVPLDKPTGMKLLKQAAVSFIPAMLKYAQLIEEENAAEAEEYYKKAADWPDPRKEFVQSQAVAQYLLASMYCEGTKIPKNPELAKAYMKRAASNGHPDAESALQGGEEWKPGKLVI